MGILNDPNAFYAPSQEDWSLGDLVIVPTAVLWASGEQQADTYPQPAPSPDGTQSVVYDLWLHTDGLTTPAIECWIGPGIIVVDDCVIDKEFNAFIEHRIREGVPEEQAIREARDNPLLDRTLLVAPVLPYSKLRFVSKEAVRDGQTVGYFPIVGSPDVDEGYADFTRIVPVSRQLLIGPAASLSDATRNILRWKLAQFYAFRNLSVDAEISAAVGKTITAVHTVQDHKQRLIVDLELNQGENSLRLRQEPRRIEIPVGNKRGRQS